MICESYFHFLLIYESISHTFFCFQMTTFSRIVQKVAQNLRVGEKIIITLTVEGGRGSAKWVNQGFGGSGGQMSNKPLLNTRKKKSFE